MSEAVSMVGTIGTFLLAICAIPAAYQAWRHKHINISWTFLLLWGGGEVALAIYFVLTEQHIIALNCYVNLCCIGVMSAFNNRRYYD